MRNHQLFRSFRVAKNETIESFEAEDFTHVKFALRKFDYSLINQIRELSDSLTQAMTYIPRNASSGQKEESKNDKNPYESMGSYIFSDYDRYAAMAKCGENKEEAETLTSLQSFEGAVNAVLFIYAAAGMTNKLVSLFKPLFKKVCFVDEKPATDLHWDFMEPNDQLELIASYVAFFGVVSPALKRTIKEQR